MSSNQKASSSGLVSKIIDARGHFVIGNVAVSKWVLKYPTGLGQPADLGRDDYLRIASHAGESGRSTDVDYKERRFRVFVLGTTRVNGREYNNVYSISPISQIPDQDSIEAKK